MSCVNLSGRGLLMVISSTTDHLGSLYNLLSRLAGATNGN